MKALYLILLVLLVSCKEPAQETVSSTNSNIKLDFLFEHDGCKMYRFLDGGRWIYWTDCSGQVTSEWTQNHGKASSQEHDQSITR